MRTTLGMGATCTSYGQWAMCPIERASESVRLGRFAVVRLQGRPDSSALYGQSGTTRGASGDPYFGCARLDRRPVGACRCPTEAGRPRLPHLTTPHGPARTDQAAVRAFDVSVLSSTSAMKV